MMNEGSQRPRLPETVLFRNTHEQCETQAPAANGHQLIENALILISLGRFNSAFVTLISAIETFLTAPGRDDENPDRRTLDQKLFEFDGSPTESEANFVWKKNSKKFERTTGYGECISLRNAITHSGYSSAYDDASARAVITVALPILETVYEKLFARAFLDALIVEIAEQITNAKTIWQRAKVEKGASRAFGPLIWQLRVLLSANYVPRFFWDREGYQRDFGDLIFDTTEEFRSAGMFEPETLFCPICGELAVVASCEIEGDAAPYSVWINKAICGHCQLRIGDSPIDRIIGDVLLGAELKEKEAAILKNYGLT